MKTNNEGKFLEPNTFQTPNVIVDIMLPHLGDAEFKCLIFIVRKTFGWGKAIDQVSISQFENGTGLSRPSIIKALKKLTKYQVVVCFDGHGFGDRYALNLKWVPKDWTPQDVDLSTPKLKCDSNMFPDEGSKKSLPVANPEVVNKIYQSSKNSLPVSSKNSLPTKPNIKPTNINQTSSSKNEEEEKLLTSASKKQKDDIHICKDGQACHRSSWHVNEFNRRHQDHVGYPYNINKTIDYATAKRLHKQFTCSQLIELQRRFWIKVTEDNFWAKNITFTVFEKTISELMKDMLNERSSHQPSRKPFEYTA